MLNLIPQYQSQMIAFCFASIKYSW